MLIFINFHRKHTSFEQFVSWFNDCILSLRWFSKADESKIFTWNNVELFNKSILFEFFNKFLVGGVLWESLHKQAVQISWFGFEVLLLVIIYFKHRLIEFCFMEILLCLFSWLSSTKLDVSIFFGQLIRINVELDRIDDSIFREQLVQLLKCCMRILSLQILYVQIGAKLWYSFNDHLATQLNVRILELCIVE